MLNNDKLSFTEQQEKEDDEEQAEDQEVREKGSKIYSDHSHSLPPLASSDRNAPETSVSMCLQDPV